MVSGASYTAVYLITRRLTENLRGETVILPPSAPGSDRLVLVSFFTITVKAEIIDGMAVYDNPQSGRPADYIELFDGAGGLLMVGWVDRFGIRRTAMDQGLLQKEASGPEEILVLLLEGVPL